MSENPWLEPLKNDAKQFVKKHPWIARIIGTIILVVALFLLIPPLTNSFNVIVNLFSGSDTKEKEETENWLLENFTDTTYNLLILPFNDYQENSKQKLKIERAIEGRIDGLRDKFFSNSTFKSLIRLKCYLDIPDFLSIDSIKNIGKKFNADIIIYGDIYNLFDKPAKRTNIKYIILNKSKKVIPFKRLGETGLIGFSSLDEIREGYLIKDIDYMILWILCNEEIYFNKIDQAVLIWNSIEKNFQEKIFSRTNAFMCALIGESCYHISDFKNSKVFFKKAIEYYHNFADAFNDLGLVYSNFSNYDSAKICYYEAIKIDPNSSNVYNNLGVLYLEKLHSYEKAKQYFKKSYELDSRNGNVAFNIGLLFGQYLKNPDSAKVYFMRALELLPDSSVIFYRSIGMSYFEQDLKKAKYYFFKAKNINSNDAITNYELGRVYEIENKIDSAKYSYKIAIQSDPDYAFAHNNLGLLYKNKLQNPKAALYHLHSALRINPGESKYNYNVGLIYEDYFQRFDSALIFYKKTISLNPNSEDATMAIAQLYRKEIKNIDSARYYYEKTIKINSKNAGAHNNLALLLYDNFSEYKLAASHFETAIKINPLLGEAYINYSTLLAKHLNNKSKAKIYYKKAISIDQKFRNKNFENFLYKNK